MAYEKIVIFGSQLPGAIVTYCVSLPGFLWDVSIMVNKYKVNGETFLCIYDLPTKYLCHSYKNLMIFPQIYACHQKTLIKMSSNAI